VAAAAEARARAEAEARLRVRVSYEDRRTVVAHEARGHVIAYLVGKCQADPGRRERVAAIERRERERRLAADAEHAARVEADALQARAQVHAYLVALGAKERPPKPPPRPEVPGDPPYEGAEWIAGDWRWEDTEWIWIDGLWSDPESFGGGGVEVGVGIGGDRVRDHRDRTNIRDHRDGKPETILRDHRSDRPEQVIRDHRDGKPEKVVRDHRDGKRHDAPLIMRDHRDGKRHDPPVVRDHRDREPRESRESRESRDSKSSSKSKSKDDDDDRKPRTRDHRR
jgi:hypothetical protein